MAQQREIHAQADRVANAIAVGNTTLYKIRDQLSFYQLSREEQRAQQPEDDRSRMRPKGDNHIPEEGAVISAIELLVER